VKPDTFAAVMATGIVSIAALDHGFRVVSDVLIVLAGGALPALIAAAATAWRPESWNLNDLDVAIRLCTYIAACAVVGARLAEYRVVLWVLAAMALQGWLSLAPVVARRMWRDRGVGLRDRAHGIGAGDKIGKRDRSAGAKLRPVLQTHPGLRDDAKDSLRPDKHPVGTRPCARAGQPERFNDSGRR